MRPAVFIDRDDTLIDDMSYTADADRIRLLPGAAEGVRRLNEAGFAVVLVTNQSGVARGHFTEEQLEAAHASLHRALERHGAALDGVYYCPFLDGPEAVVPTYRRASELRKPAPGMLLLAAQEMDLDLEASWMIGDAVRDVQAGRAAGCRTILIGMQRSVAAADHAAKDLASAVDIVLAAGAISDANAAAAGNHAHLVEAAVSGVKAVAPRATAASMDIEARGVEQGVITKHANGIANGVAHAAFDNSRAIAARNPSQPREASDQSARGVTSGMDDLLRELRQWRRESSRRDFTPGHVLGVVAQCIAMAFVGWGLYAILDSRTDAVVRLMAAVFFQVMAMTYLRR